MDGQPKRGTSRVNLRSPARLASVADRSLCSQNPLENSNNLGLSALNLLLATFGQTAPQFRGLKFLGDRSHLATYASASFQARGEDKDLASVVWETAFFWRTLDTLDYWLTQARLWRADAVCGPRPETPADQESNRDRDRRALRKASISLMQVRSRRPGSWPKQTTCSPVKRQFR
jgi:hypothetical protein